MAKLAVLWIALPKSESNLNVSSTQRDLYQFHSPLYANAGWTQDRLE